MLPSGRRRPWPRHRPSARARSMSAGLLATSRLNRTSPDASTAQARCDDLPTSKARRAAPGLALSSMVYPLLKLADRRPRERQPHYGAVGQPPGMSLSVACRGEPSPAATPPGPSREAGRKGRPGRSASDPSGSTSIVFPRLGRIQRSRARAGSNCNGRAAHAEQPRHHAYRGLHLHQQVYLRYPGSWRRRRRPFSGAHSPSPAWRNALLGGGQLGGPVAGRPAASSPSSRSLLSIRSLKVLESSPSPRQRAAIFLPEAMRSPQSPCGTRARICSLGSAPMFAAPLSEAYGWARIRDSHPGASV